MVPALQAAVVTGVHGNGDTTEDVTFVRTLLKVDPLIAPNDGADLAEDTALYVL
jgi:hypothetical protein